MNDGLHYNVALMTFHAGLHHHYKGFPYVALQVAKTHNHNGDADVIYVSCTTGELTTRPLTQDSRKEDAWADLVEWPDSLMHPRFAHHSVFRDAWYIMPCGHRLGIANNPKPGLCNDCARLALDRNPE